MSPDRATVRGPTLALRSWFANRSLREQRLFAVLGCVALAVLLVLGVVRPVQRARTQALADMHSYELLDAELRAAGPSLGSRPHRSIADPALVVPAAAEKAGLAVERIEPEGGRVRLTLADVPFPALVGLLADLEREDGIAAVEARIDPAADAGHVDAQLLLGRS